ncbi:MAG: sensor domain-containing diguanylate cyclase [Dehalococcoidia bacterium]|jgi:diguanylate cyclase (GGDEF)-like protein/PAS domain S-box-containing protein|nr:sensor domain-containing diguanylate cyclase [Dehalococcoidia bacterium]
MDKLIDSSFERLIQEDERLKAFNDTVPVGILVIEVESGRPVYSNQFFRELLGADGDQVLGQSWENFFVDAQERENLMVKFSVEDEVRNFELRLRRIDGEVMWGLASMSEIPVEEESLLLFAFVDITRLKSAEAAIQHLADHDQLTGLPARRLLQSRLDQVIVRAAQTEAQIGVFFIDLDGFKNINDTFGHNIGDLVLKETANRLADSVQEKDMVARLGGDEFLIVAEEQGSQSAESIGKLVLDNVSRAIETAEGEVKISASIGIALYPDNGLTPEELIKAADNAMYGVKKTGKGAIAFA